MTERVLNLPGGIAISVAQPFAEGHVLTTIEAAKLNQTFADAIRTSLMAKLTRLKEVAKNEGKEVDVAAATADFQSYANEYEFSERGTRAVVDPVEVEARKIAKDQVLTAIRDKGGKVRDYSAEQIDAYVTKVLENRPQIREEAERRVNSTRQIAGDLLSDLGF